MNTTTTFPNASGNPGTPSAGGAETNPADADNAPVPTAFPTDRGIEDAESAEPARLSKTDQRQPIISFTSAYWDRLLGKTPDEPAAADYGLPEPLAEAIRRQCVIERNAQLYIKALKLAAAQQPSTRS